MASDPVTPQTGFALEVFLLDAQARNLSPHTVQYYRRQIGWFGDYMALHGCHHLGRITPHHIRSYLLHLREERDWQPASVQAAARAIRAFLNFCCFEVETGNLHVARFKKVVWLPRDAHAMQVMDRIASSSAREIVCPEDFDQGYAKWVGRT